MSSSLNHSKTILTNVRILRGKSNESFFGQPDSVAMIVVAIDFRICDVRRPSFQSMLADHNRAPLARGDAFGYQKNAVREYAGPDVQHDFIPAKLWLVVDQ